MMSNDSSTIPTRTNAIPELECEVRSRKEQAMLARRWPHRSKTEDGTIGWDDIVRAAEECYPQLED